MKQTLLTIALFGLASCASFNSQYLPPNQQSRLPSPQQPAQYSGAQQSAQYSGAQQSAQYSGAQQSAKEVPIIRLENNNNGDGTYNFALETGDGISVQEQGDATGDGTKAQGGFSYTAPDGQQIQIQYAADENGFQPQGAHLPTAPPVPEEIQRAVEQNLADEARGVFDDGQYKDEAGPAQKYAQSSGGNQYAAQNNGGSQYSAQKSQGGYKY